MAAAASLRLENSYARELQGFSVPWRPEAAPAPKSLFFNAPLAEELGLDAAVLAGEAGAALFAGNTVPEGAEPIAQAYAGHQFGGFSPQLGDGRAVLLGEVIDRAGRRRDIALKGSGRTPFSRGGDGKAAVGPMLREVLIGEAMHALGIPTTRALAVVATGQPVFRETVLPGAVLTRVAASHIRVGTFQYFAARGDVERVRQLAEYSIARHDPDLVGTPGRFPRPARARVRAPGGADRAVDERRLHPRRDEHRQHDDLRRDDRLRPVRLRRGLRPAAVFSSIDSRGRYAFGNQPAIAQWNLTRLAETLLPLIAEEPEDAAKQATVVIEAFPALYRRHLLAGQRTKLGLRAAPEDDDAPTPRWRGLARAAARRPRRLHARLAAPGRRGRRRRDAAARALPRSSGAGRVAGPVARALRARRRTRPAGRKRRGARGARMRSVNPWVIPRNHRSRKRSPPPRTTTTSARSTGC
jgi:uncharacterized protein YdiU (UPF0061 family)